MGARSWQIGLTEIEMVGTLFVRQLKSNEVLDDLVIQE
jgi:hypothetical protein